MALPEARVVTSDHPVKVRMLVLETDEPHPETQQEKGSIGEMLADLLKRAGDEHDPSLGIETLMQFVVEPAGGTIPKPEEITDDIHAILITGSVYDAHSDEPWIHKLIDFIKHIWTHRPDIRFSGICFGHQILCRTLGSTVRPNQSGEWELSHTPIALTDIGRSLFNFSHEEKTIRLHQMHLDTVLDAPVPANTPLLPDDAKVHVWGSSAHTLVQGVYVQRRLFTTQGHMEFDETMVRRQLALRVEKGSLGVREADEATERAEWMHDGLVVAKAVLRFFHGDDDKVD
ncbi:class I glutamine amidotransferase-like protein [Massarina eburnea CBS 473.64]|uniref:Class I glutamine amidotransferase-like protein n=1 Tax=Massarina eburnea CBS 473.64 TaxID=1395130 RepID=A0A6A6RN46_9PLEO|nr:class I glutamine amidotransferase-like protein [Massarina eburnea CBS 473.64]